MPPPPTCLLVSDPARSATTFIRSSSREHSTSNLRLCRLVFFRFHIAGRGFGRFRTMGPYTGGGNAGDPLIADTPTMALDDDETFHTFIDPSAFDEETEAFDSNVFHSLDPMDTGEYKHFTNEGLDNNLFGMAHDSPSGSFLDTSSESSRQQFESSNASPLTDTHMGDMELLNDSKSPEYTSASSYSNMDGSMDQAPDFSVSPEADPSGRIGAAKQEPRSTAPVPKKPAKAKRTRAPPRARAPAQRKQKKVGNSLYPLFLY